jgi:hypothetical protein
LIYAHKNGAPLTEHTFYEAVKEGYINCIKYLYKNNCPINKDKCMEITYCPCCIDNEKSKCIDFLKEKLNIDILLLFNGY